ncbi:MULTISPECIES: CDP-glucose 4,6-dehydratase [unclassified Marinovum]|uniref:CDP-glucose 4,6-dehydratase n=1 Tax=unclassified Marinovum TaxID=2647166 RepID=UPI003EDBF0E5
MDKVTHRRVTPEFWRGKRVFLTGHTGFKGSWLTVWLAALGARTTGFSLPPHTSPAMFNLLQLAGNTTHHIGDIRDADALKQAMRAAEPDVVIHMAAQPIVSEGYQNPVGTFGTNVMGVVNILEACREIDREIPVVIISSDKCYRNDDQNQDFVVSDPLGGHDPYSASKAGTEIVTNAYRDSYFSRNGTPRLASGRAGNVIGGGDYSFDRLLADGARAFAADTPLVLRNPLATRPWQHVLEPLYGYMVLAEALAEDCSFARPWNFGPDQTENRAVRDLANAFALAWGANRVVDVSTKPQDWREATALGLDCTETQDTLGWRPVLDLPEAIQWTADWYRTAAESATKSALRAITETQIARYEELQSNRP